MHANFEPNPNTPEHSELVQTEFDFLDSPFDRWLRITDMLLAKYRNPEKTTDHSDC